MLAYVHMLLFVIVKWVDDDEVVEAVFVPYKVDAWYETGTVDNEIHVDVDV